SGADAIEISHEALIPSWTWLRELVQQNRQFLAWRKHTRAAVRAFAERHEDAVLLRGRYLAEAMEFRAARADDLTPEELAFIAASAAAAARAKLLRRLVGAALLVLAIAASYGFIQARQRGDALQARTDEFDLLAGVWQLKAAREKEATLYPAWPEKLAAMEDWLAWDVPRLREALPKLKAGLASLKSRAKPRSAEDLEADRRAHPRFAELEALRVLLTWRKHGRGPDPGGARPELPALPSELAQARAKALNSYAWARVDPDRERDVPPAEAPLALAAAQRAVARIEGGDASVALHMVLDTLAWAWLALGQGDEAIAASRRAHEAAPEKDREEYARLLARIEAAARELAGEAGQRAVDELQRHQTELEARIENERRYEFDADSDRFLFEALRSQDLAIEDFLAKELAGVEQRRDFAKRLRDLATTRDAARWAAVSAAVRAKHGIDLKPQGGLVPLGANPKTGYFEFYELRSAWDGKSDPASIAIPAHEADGRIAVKDQSGIVFVLLPGGTITLGAQRTDPKGPNYETDAESDESVHEVRLAPFFLARHELTQAQYLRLTGQRNPSSFAAGERTSTDERAIGWAHPVETLDWDMARQALEPHGLILPTEAQWEYGCRGGTTTAWYAGSEAHDLRGHARLSDSALEGDPLQDQWSAHWPVGTGSPNAFGLFDVHGNVWEWCRDWYGDYGTEHPGDGLHGEEGSSGHRVGRGGSSHYSASLARSAYRHRPSKALPNVDLGLRAARIITE
ncbi:MAG: formylglycine-generating enzyme family protein, partial [Planctomycetes bacterium]|nr:formylglycine-generating enzyme family protein [Planctomycetota bacterium]